MFFLELQAVAVLALDRCPMCRTPDPNRGLRHLWIHANPVSSIGGRGYHHGDYYAIMQCVLKVHNTKAYTRKFA